MPRLIAFIMFIVFAPSAALADHFDDVTEVPTGAYCIAILNADATDAPRYLSDWFPEHYYHCSTGEIWDVTWHNYDYHCIKNRYLDKYLSGVKDSVSGQYFSDTCGENEKFHFWPVAKPPYNIPDHHGFCIENMSTTEKWLTTDHGAYTNVCTLEHFWHVRRLN